MKDLTYNDQFFRKINLAYDFKINYQTNIDIFCRVA